MKDRRAVLPYPEKSLRRYGELERFLLYLKDGKMPPSYADLPTTFTAIALEAYGNWLARETATDPLHFERGSVVFYDQGQSRIVFPRNPQTGEHQAKIFVPSHPDCVVLISSHSHPDQSPFSSEGDLVQFLISHDNIFSFKYLPSMQVTSQRYNYLIIRAADTISLDTERYWLHLQGFSSHKDIKEIRAHFSYANQYGTGLTKTAFNALHYRSGVNLVSPSSFDHFYETFFSEMLFNYYLSLKYQYGFYFSKKDGQYRRVDLVEIISLLGESINERFAQAAKLLD